VVTKAGSNRGKTYYLSATNQWVIAQQKTTVNQEPLFDIVTSLDVSLASAYTESSFAGCALFSYRKGSSIADPILGFNLSYASTGGSIGQLNFTNNYCADQFTYISDTVNRVVSTLNPNVGFIRKITGRLASKKLNNWNTITNASHQYQHVSSIYDGTTSYVELGAEPELDTLDTPTVKVFVNNKQLTRFTTAATFGSITGTALTTTVTGANAASYATIINTYYNRYLGRHADQTGLDFWVNKVNSGVLTLSEVETQIINSEEVYRLATGFSVETVGVRWAVKINQSLLTVGDRIDVVFYSKQPSELAYYEIPKNLELNPQNSEITELTLGQLRNHLQQIGENTKGLIGSVLAQSNIRDHDIQSRPGTILQHSSPIVYCSLFLLDQQANFINSIDYARREYTRFKNKFLE